VDRLPRGFREGLRRELPRWEAEGAVAPEVARALAKRYGVDRADAGGPSFLAVYVLGAALVGSSIVSLVAWHWEAMSRGARLLVVLAAMLAAHGAAFTLDRLGRHPRLAHALAVLGTLVFGANIALVAQIFQVSGEWYGIFGAFAVGALGAGLALESLPTLVAGAISALFLWGPGYADVHASAGVAACYGIVLAILALAWRHRSALLVVVAGLGAATTLAAAGDFRTSILPILSVAAALAAGPLVARGERARLGAAARVSGRLAFYAVAFSLSFAEGARSHRLEGGMSPALLGATLPPAILAALLLARGLRRDDVDPLARGEAMLIAFTIPAILAGLSLRDAFGAAIVANLSLAFLALGRMVRGLSSLARAPFWEGIVVATVLVVARFIEIETRLWLKGAAFIACGVAVTVAGLAFERRLASRPSGEVSLAR